MFNQNYDPYAILEDLQNQFQRMAFHQQQMSAAIQAITATQIRQQQQIESLGNLNQLLNNKIDIVQHELKEQIKAHNQPQSPASQ
jgi:hypothetical protein